MTIDWQRQFYEHKNGSFEAVTHGGMLVYVSGHLEKRYHSDQCCSYYLQRNARNETVQPLPDGLRMLAGNPYARSDSQNQESKAISWLWSVSFPNLHDNY